MLCRLIALYVSLSLAALPVTKALAEAAQVAKALEEAKTIKQQAEDWFKNNLKGPQEGELRFGTGVNNTLKPETSSINVNALFPGQASGQSQADFEHLYGKDEQLAGEAIKRSVELQTEDSPAGEAYRMFDTGIKSNPRPDLTHDPIFKSWDLMHQFVDTKEPQCQEAGSHTPQPVTCRRPTSRPKYCSGHRVFGVFHHTVNGFVGARMPSGGTVRARFDFVAGTYEILPGSGTIYQAFGKVPKKLDPNEVCKSNHPHIQFAGATSWHIPEAPAVDPTYQATIEQPPSCENGLTAVVRFWDVKGGKPTIYQGVQFIWDIYGISEDNWVWDRSDCPADIAAIESGTCNGSVECSVNPQDCVTVDGLTFCGEELKAPPANVPRGCRQIKVHKQCGMAMTQDDECITLEQKGCAWQKSDCVLRDDAGACLVTEDTYDCGIKTGSDAACQAALAMQDMVRDCKVTVTPTKETRIVHHPKYITCEILRRLTKCTASRNLSISRRTENLNFFRLCFDRETITFRAGWTYDTTLAGSNYGWIQGQVWNRNFTLWANATLTYTGENTSATIVQQPAKENDWTAVVELTGPGQWVDVPNPDYQACQAKKAQNPSTDCSGIPPTKKEMQCPAGTYISGTLTVRGDKLDYGENYNPAEPENNPCLKEADDWTNVAWECRGAVGPVGGYLIPPEMLIPLYPGDNGSCQVAEATYDPKDYNVGIGECWIDAQGEYRCLDNTSPEIYPPHPPERITTNCTKYEEDPRCTLVRTGIVKRSNGYGGFTYVLEKRFDCGENVEVEYEGDAVYRYDCPSPLQCMGETCIQHPNEASADFPKAAALLQAAQQAQMDLNCGDDDDQNGQPPGEINPLDCRVFSGHHMECKKAVGGWQDCCETPRGVSIFDYIEMILTIGHLDSSIMALKGAQMLEGVELAQSFIGGWERLRTPVVTQWTQITQPFTSMLENIIAQVTTKEAAHKIASGIIEKGPIDYTIEQVKNYLIEATKKWLETTFKQSGTAISKFLFGACSTGGCQAPAKGAAQEAGKKAAEEAGKAATSGSGSGGLVGMISTVLNIAVILYSIYSILDILVNIIWACDMQEFQLGVQKELRNCHYVGSYCHGFLCVEKRESYCCFNSPLARIINVQAKQQLGGFDDDPENPSCSGLTLDELNRIDWNRIDLSEWIEILNITCDDNCVTGKAGDTHYPTRFGSEPTMEDLTGEGSFLNVDPPDGLPKPEGMELPRPNLEERSKERIDPIQGHDVRSRATRELYP